MSLLKHLENILIQIKRKISTFRTEKQINCFLNNYKESPEFDQLYEILSKINLIDMEKFIDRSNIHEDEMGYQNLIEEAQNYSVGLFFFPKGSILPYHDHLNMAVFSKIISGCLHLSSYDRINRKEKDLNYFEVKLKEENQLKKDDISILTPANNNIHQIVALDDSIMFDVLIPDYGENDCNYYNKIKIDNREYMKKIDNL